MLVGDDYKRAAGLVELNDASPLQGIPGCALRLSWALSRVSPVPTPDLASRLAGALLELCGPQRAALVQLGRLDKEGAWRVEASGLAGRSGENLGGGPGPMHDLAWPSLPPADTGPIYVVSEPPGNEPSLKPIEAALHRVNLEVELAALACPAQRDGLVMTVQLGGRRGDTTPARAALLRQVLPWAHDIARAAVGEGEGRTLREWLTDREQQVLERLVCGDSVVAIARALDRSRYTVHDHAKSLHRKLGVRSRAALVGCVTVGVPPPQACPQPPVHGPGEAG